MLSWGSPCTEEPLRPEEPVTSRGPPARVLWPELNETRAEHSDTAYVRGRCKGIAPGQVCRRSRAVDGGLGALDGGGGEEPMQGVAGGLEGWVGLGLGGLKILGQGGVWG